MLRFASNSMLKVMVKRSESHTQEHEGGEKAGEERSGRETVGEGRVPQINAERSKAAPN